MHYPEVTKDYEKDVSSSPQDDKQPYTVAPTIGIPVSTPVTTSYTRPAQRPAQLPTIAPPSQRPAQMPTIAPPSPLEETAEVPWSSGLCDCFSDMGNCCITCLCPCVTFGQISEIVDQGSTTCGLNGAIYALINVFTCCPCIGCACIYSSCYRSKMRQRYSQKGNPSSDCLLHCFCECCALCQEYRELQSRGFDAIIGWHGNVRRQNHGASVAQGHPVTPIVEKGMSRDG